MALTLPQAIQRIPQGILSGIAKTIMTTDQMSAFLPFQPSKDPSFRFIREGSLPVGGVFLDDSGVSTEESTGTDDQVTAEYRRIVGNMDVDELANSLSGGVQTGVQLQKKVKATWRNVQNIFINGGRTTSHTLTPATGSPAAAIGAATYSPWLDSDRRGPGGLMYTNGGTTWRFRAPGDLYGDPVTAATNGTYRLYSYNRSKWISVVITVASATADGEIAIRFNTTNNQFDGIEQLVDPAMVIPATGANGDDYSVAILDALITKVKQRANLSFVMPSSMLEKHYAAMRVMGGTEPSYVEIPYIIGGRVPIYRGIPMLVNDWVPADETVGSTSNASSIYLASLDAEEGLSMAVPSYGGETAIGEADPRNVPVMGFRITDIGALEGKDARRTRVAFYGTPVLKSPLALARKTGVKTV